MNPQPLHRSITLWSGILILLFIAWSRIDVQSHNTYFYANLRKSILQIGQDHYGFVAIVSFPEPGAPNYAFQRQHRNQRLPDIGLDPFRIYTSSGPDRYFTHVIRLHHGLLFATVAIIWTTLLYRRHRRIHRSMKSEAAATAASEQP